MTVITVATAVAETSAPLSDPVSDGRVAALLQAAGLSYQVDEDGDFRLLYELADGRSQVAWVASGTTRLQTVEIRDVWSVAHRSTGPLDAEFASRLLADNAVRVLGAWQVQRSGDEYLVVYSAQIAADATALPLPEALDAVVKAADEMERQLGEADRF